MAIRVRRQPAQRWMSAPHATNPRPTKETGDVVKKIIRHFQIVVDQRKESSPRYGSTQFHAGLTKMFCSCSSTRTRGETQVKGPRRC